MLGHYYMPVLCNYAAMKMNVLSYTHIIDSYTQNNILYTYLHNKTFHILIS